MAQDKLTDRTELAEEPNANDWFYVVDVSDSTDDATGSSKKVKYSNINSGVSGTSLTNTYFLSDYGVQGDGVDYENGSMTSGSANLNVTDTTFTAADVGKIIVQSGAGAGGNFLRSSIVTFTDANNVVLADTASTTVSNTDGYYGTDDTNNIQTAINNVFSQGGGDLIGEDGIYCIDGDLQNGIVFTAGTINYNSQLYVPYQEFVDKSRNTVVLRSISQTSPQQGTALDVIVGDRRASNNGLVFRSSGRASGVDPSVIASVGVVDSANANPFRLNAADLRFKGINFQYVPYGNKPELTYLNFEKGNTLIGDDCSIYPYLIHLSDTEEPTTSVGAVVMPSKGTGVMNRLTGFNVAGFFHGYKAGDHAILIGNHNLACVNGVTPHDNEHQITLVRHLSQWTKYHLNGEDTANITGVINTEWSNEGYWYDNIAGVNDLENLLQGNIQFNVVLAGGGFDNSKFVKFGGKKLRCIPLAFDDNTKHLVEDGASIENLTNALKSLNNTGLLDYIPNPYNSFYGSDDFSSDVISKLWTQEYQGTIPRLIQQNNRLEAILTHADDRNWLLLNESIKTSKEVGSGTLVVQSTITTENDLATLAFGGFGIFQNGSVQDGVVRIRPSIVTSGEVTVQIRVNNSTVYALETGVDATGGVPFKIVYDFAATRVYLYYHNGTSWIELDAATAKVHDIHDGGTLDAFFTVNDDNVASSNDFTYFDNFVMHDEDYDTLYPSLELNNGASGTSITIDWANDPFQKVLMTDNCTFTFTDPSKPATLIFKIVQDGIGSRTITLPANVNFSGGTLPTWSTTANAVDIMSMYWDGENYHAAVILDSQ